MSIDLGLLIVIAAIAIVLYLAIRR